MNLWKTFLRWRHSKGYGVHSPYAYRFVINVLNPGEYCYYSFREIDNNLSSQEFNDGRFIRQIQFTIRLVNFLKAKRIVTTKSTSRLTKITADSMDINWCEIPECGKFNFLKNDLLITGGPSGEVDALGNAINYHIPIFAVNPSSEIRNFMEKPLEKGLLLNDKNEIILIPREEMEYLNYPILLNRSRRVNL